MDWSRRRKKSSRLCGERLRGYFPVSRLRNRRRAVPASTMLFSYCMSHRARFAITRRSFLECRQLLQMGQQSPRSSDCSRGAISQQSGFRVLWRNLPKTSRSDAKTFSNGPVVREAPLYTCGARLFCWSAASRTPTPAPTTRPSCGWSARWMARSSGPRQTSGWRRRREGVSPADSHVKGS